MTETTSLLCDEVLLGSLPSSPGANVLQRHDTQSRCAAAAVSFYTTEEDRDHALKECLRKQRSYMPRNGYAEHLRRSSDLSDSRLRAIRWIVRAWGRLNLAFGTVFYALNYLDRFISVYSSMKWECWMMELLSLACLSIAAKFDEVSIPSLHQLPMEDLDHSFQPNTIQRMELAVLRALDWRLHCVTSYSYVDLLTWRLDSLHHRNLRGAVTCRMTELLVGASLDVKFLEFSPCTLALSALRCGLEEHVPLRSDGYLSDLTRLIPQEQMDEKGECHKSMEERVADPLCGTLTATGSPYSASSPATVISPPERTEIFDCYVDIDIFFKTHVLNDDSSCSDPKKQPKRKEMESWTGDCG